MPIFLLGRTQLTSPRCKGPGKVASVLRKKEEIVGECIDLENVIVISIPFPGAVFISVPSRSAKYFSPCSGFKDPPPEFNITTQRNTQFG